MIKAISLRSIFFSSFLIITSILCILVSPVYCQFPFPRPLPYNYGFPGLPFPQYFPMQTNIPIVQIQIKNEFFPRQFIQNNISLYIKSDEPVSVLIGIMSKNGGIFYIEAIPEDGGKEFFPKELRIVIPLGGDKLNGQWHEWVIVSISTLISEIGQAFDFIATIEIRGNAFCIGPIIAFSEDEDSGLDTSYIESFSDRRDTIEDYGWTSTRALKVEYNYPLSDDIEEGYLCLTPNDQNQQQSLLPKIPITLPLPSAMGLGPILPVTIFSEGLPYPYQPLPILYPPITSLYRTVASQLYSTPINPIVSLGLLKSLPLYFNSISGLPYSIGANKTLAQRIQPTTIIDYSDPAYTYLKLD